MKIKKELIFMMSVLEYAQDVNKTVEEILKKCKELGIDANDEEEDSFNELKTKFYKIPTDMLTNAEMVECSGQYLYINCSLYNV